jgi:hypothetical protein
MAANFQSDRFTRGIILKADDVAIESVEGALKTGLTSKQLHAYLDGASRTIATLDQAQEFTNKTIDADDNSISNLEVDNLKAGVLNTSTTLATASDTQLPSALAVKTYVDNKAAAQNEASEISFTPTGTIAATNVQTMGAELDGDIQAEITRATAAEAALQSDINDVGSDLGAHIVDAVDAHDASAISLVPFGEVASTNMQDGIEELGTILTTEIDATNTTVATKVTKAASSTDNAIARFDGITGGVIQNSVATLSDAGALAGVTSLTVDSLNLDGDTITGGTSTIGLGTNIVETTASKILNGRSVFSPADISTSGSNVTITPGANKTLKLTNASLTSIDLIDSTVDGQEVILINATGNDVVVNNNIGANGILTGTGSSVTLKNGAAFSFTYNNTTSRWNLVGGSGSGGSQVPDVFVQLVADEQISTWTTGNNATFLGGGTVSGTLARETSSPLNGTASYKYTQAAGSLNDYFASPVQSVPIRFRGNTATVSLPYLYNGNNDDITLVVYDVTNATVLTNSAFNSIDATGSNSSTFVANVFIPLTCTQIRVGFQTIVENSGKIFQFDDIQVGSDATKYANLIEPRIAVIAAGNAGQAITATVTNIPFIETEDTFGLWNGSQFTAPSDGDYLITGMVAATASVASWEVSVYINGVVSKSISRTESGSPVLLSGQVSLTAGQVLSFRSSDNCTLLNTTTTHHLYIEKVPRNTSTNIVTSAETFSTDTAALTYAGSATYTLSTLANAPVGTFITFTYAINTNTRTQTTTAPTQTTSDMNSNGIQIFTRAYNAASTAAQPAAIAIQIGKGMKGVTKDLYKSAGKVTSGSLDSVLAAADTGSFGLDFKEYNESTGILILDAGFNDVDVTSHNFRFSDLTAQTNGYVVINASKNPALTGIGASIVAARGVNTAGTSIATTDTVIVFDTAKTFDTTGSLNTSTGIFTAPITGYYNVSSTIGLASDTYAVNGGVNLSGYKNSAIYSSAVTRSQAAASLALNVSYSDQVYLAAGDTFEMRASTTAGPTALDTTAGRNYFSITKVNVG